MVKCGCGKTITNVPNWLASVKVQFVCNNCPNRELQGITQVDLTGGRLEEEAPKRVVDGDEPEAELDEEEEDED
jgi:hypothetical protein